MTHLELFDHWWWAQALVQRWELDRETARTKREAGVEVDSYLERELGPEHALDEKERAWVADRVNDALIRHLTARNEARAALEEPHEAHEARALHETALRDFERPHAAEREAIAAAIERTHAIKAARRKSPLHELPADETIDGHVRALRERDHYVRRHVATQRMQVTAERRHRAHVVSVGDAAAAASRDHAGLVAWAIAEVERDMRAILSGRPAPSRPEPRAIRSDEGLELEAFLPDS